MKKLNTVTVVVIAVAIAGAAILGGTYVNNRSKTATEEASMSRTAYSLTLSSGTDYKTNEQNKLSFSVKSENGEPLKDYQTVHEKIMHFIVVRKDLASFQHLHPEFNEQSGQFTLDNLTFTSDGVYRVFADFTPKGAAKDEVGNPLPTTLDQDVNVGDVSKYQPQSIGADTVVSNQAGYSTNIVSVPSGGFIAKADSRVTVAFDKDGSSYKNLEKYLGALGHMVVLGENELEYIHAHALSEDIANQDGTVQFAVDFPKAGKYKLFLQTQAEGKVVTTDYVVTVKDAPGTTNQNMPGGEHGSGH